MSNQKNIITLNVPEPALEQLTTIMQEWPYKYAQTILAFFDAFTVRPTVDESASNEPTIKPINPEQTEVD